MKCTNCNTGELVPSFIDGLFRAHTCSGCKGNWILIQDYVGWKERNPEFAFDNEVNYQVDDSKGANLCPMTGAIMRKFRISASNTYRIDYSSGVGGVWLDSGEWELIKEEGLAGSLNAVLTSHWQRNIRQISTRDNFYEIYLEKFGQEAYDKIKDLRSWLNRQPNKAELRAYLLAEDPYTTEK
ncbi:zf-TFIIB domain-containing protein [Thalassomonas haliotis]|uniref:Zf-TFIIB domain-containing protein n=1 Tax=Thalassomonas haliotis TaxID=485448 RepID=A0ABY7VDR5_9GAMM|nr:zf-TFIIB domain-containing protein [Thalassomonas haliotis]WDE11810.1 zf-TFIIB domain-containing protein [Thalassomonas haliotis]